MYSQLTDRQLDYLMKIRTATIGECKKGCNYGLLNNGHKCDCRIIFDWIYKLVSANIPKPYWGLDIMSLKIPDSIRNLVIKALNSYDAMLSEGLGFIFSGTNGIGKTSMLCEIGKHFLSKNIKVFYVLADNLIQSFMNPDILNTKYPLDYFDVLLIDELDKVYIKAGSDYSLKELEKFFRNTLPYNKLVCAAMNYTIDEFSEKFGESTLSMIKRHLKFVSYTSQDQSKALHDKWQERLKTVSDVLKNKQLIEAAKRAYKNERK